MPGSCSTHLALAVSIVASLSGAFRVALLTTSAPDDEQAKPIHTDARCAALFEQEVDIPERS